MEDMEKSVYYFHAGPVQKIIEAVKAKDSFVELSLDLNLSFDRFEIKGNCLVLDKTLEIDIKRLEPIVSTPQKVFVLSDEGLVPIEVRADGYYKLVPTDTVPTLEINGIKMHRSKDIDPFVDAREKTKLVVKPGDMVLDTCGGLGYSAIFALKAGAGRVLSTEKSRPVIRIRNQNPWLRTQSLDPTNLLSTGAQATGRKTIDKKNIDPVPVDPLNIDWVNADITRYIRELDDKTFDSVVHDPPRFTSATGALYGKEFYSQLFRVMKPVSRLFHYTGNPKKIKHQDRFILNAMKRLEQVGFSKVVFNDRLQGIHALKNRLKNHGRGEPVWKTTFK
jgi:predicted methyltransferase